MKKLTIDFLPFLFSLYLLVSAECFAYPAEKEAPVSLFFTNKEMEQIESLAAKTPDQTLAPDRFSVSLGAVIYASPSDWTIWLQGERWTPTTAHSFISVKEVDFNRVKLSLLLPGGEGSPKEITLRPYETYDPLTDRVTKPADFSGIFITP